MDCGVHWRSKSNGGCRAHNITEMEPVIRDAVRGVYKDDESVASIDATELQWCQKGLKIENR